MDADPDCRLHRFLCVFCVLAHSESVGEREEKV